MTKIPGIPGIANGQAATSWMETYKVQLFMPTYTVAGYC